MSGPFAAPAKSADGFGPKGGPADADVGFTPGSDLAAPDGSPAPAAGVHLMRAVAGFGAPPHRPAGAGLDEGTGARPSAQRGCVPVSPRMSRSWPTGRRPRPHGAGRRNRAPTPEAPRPGHPRAVSP